MAWVPSRARPSAWRFHALLTAPWAAFHLSLALLGALSDSGPYLALEGAHLPFALYSQTALLPPRARVPPGCHRLRRPVPGPWRAGRRPTTGIRDRLPALRSPLLRGSRLISAPGLTDMLKFGPCSRAAQGRLPRACRATPAANCGATARRAAGGQRRSRVDGSRASGVAAAFRSGMRSSSTPEPRDPPPRAGGGQGRGQHRTRGRARVILPQVPLRQPCYDFSFLQTMRLAGLPRVRTARQIVRVGRSDGRCVQRTGT